MLASPVVADWQSPLPGCAGTGVFDDGRLLPLGRPSAGFAGRVGVWVLIPAREQQQRLQVYAGRILASRG